MNADQSDYRYLNLAEGWQNFKWHGLTVDSCGNITLARLAKVVEVFGQVGAPITQAAEPAGVTGDGVDFIYFSDPETHRVFRLNTCSGISQPLACFTGRGVGVGQLQSPRGLRMSRDGLLYVADSGNNRIQVVDLRTGDVRADWGQPPAFDEPWDLAIDHSGDVYVIERGGPRLRKFHNDGNELTAFGVNAGTQIALSQPSNITITELDDIEHLCLLDIGLHEVLILDLTGNLRSRWILPANIQPVGIVAIGSALFIGNNAKDGELLQFDLQGNLVGPASGYKGPVAALGLLCDGSFLLYPGSNASTIRLCANKAFVREGTFLTGPFESRDGTINTAWRRLRTSAYPLPTETNVQFFSYVSNWNDPPTLDPESPFTASDGWKSLPANRLEGLFRNPPARYLWIGGCLQGNGQTSPTITQMQISYPTSTYAHYLPALYQEDGDGRKLLNQILALFESTLGSVEQQTIDMPLLFDPFAAPIEWASWLIGWQQYQDATQQSRNWLPWLASWSAFDLDETWSESKTRRAIATSFCRYGMRGTKVGLRSLIKLYAGVDVWIEEPGRLYKNWSLGDSSCLGFDTALPPAGMVGGANKLLAEDAAYLFCVWIYKNGQNQCSALMRTKEVLDREKPAHTDYQICEIKPRYRIGVQARIGIDGIVGRPTEEWTLGEKKPLGQETVLSVAGSESGAWPDYDSREGQRTGITGGPCHE
ncbi:MAG: phage tail protein [Anaerolineales bacterium]